MQLKMRWLDLVFQVGATDDLLLPLAGFLLVVSLLLLIWWLLFHTLGCWVYSILITFFSSLFLLLLTFSFFRTF